jgi:ABC-type Zn uptake system ZnuABC Zn-binding protein ZnuA
MEVTMNRDAFINVLGPSLIGTWLLASCAGATGTPVNPAQPSVDAAVPAIKAVATFSIAGDLARNVGGGRIELVTLVGSDADVHDFEVAPSDAARVADAHILFENGLGLEPWLENLYAASGSRAERIVLSDGVQARVAGEGETHRVNNASAQGPVEYDPHVWQDVRNAIQMTRNIQAGLSQVDPDGAAIYRKNADAYIATLEVLDRDLVAMAEELPADRRKLITSHDSLGYFAHRYGFTIVGSILKSLTTATGEPSAQDIAALVDAIKREDVRAIFLENAANPQLVERVASQAGVQIGPELYTDALGPADSAGATYVGAMRFNARAIVDALQ